MVFQQPVTQDEYKSPQMRNESYRTSLNYAPLFANLHGFRKALPQPAVLAASRVEALIESTMFEGDITT